jgi:hypothetical protein
MWLPPPEQSRQRPRYTCLLTRTVMTFNRGGGRESRTVRCLGPVTAEWHCSRVKMFVLQSRRRDFPTRLPSKQQSLTHAVKVKAVLVSNWHLLAFYAASKVPTRRITRISLHRFRSHSPCCQILNVTWAVLLFRPLVGIIGNNAEVGVLQFRYVVSPFTATRLLCFISHSLHGRCFSMRSAS